MAQRTVGKPREIQLRGKTYKPRRLRKRTPLMALSPVPGLGKAFQGERAKRAAELGRRLAAERRDWDERVRYHARCRREAWKTLGLDADEEERKHSSAAMAFCEESPTFIPGRVPVGAGETREVCRWRNIRLTECARKVTVDATDELPWSWIDARYEPPFQYQEGAGDHPPLDIEVELPAGGLARFYVEQVATLDVTAPMKLERYGIIATVKEAWVGLWGAGGEAKADIRVHPHGFAMEEETGIKHPLGTLNPFEAFEAVATDDTLEQPFVPFDGSFFQPTQAIELEPGDSLELTLEMWIRVSAIDGINSVQLKIDDLVTIPYLEYQTEKEVWEVVDEIPLEE